MFTARERNQKRRQQREGMATRPRDARQVQNPDSFKMPTFKMPFNRRFLLIPLGIAFILVVILFFALVKPPEVKTAPNAIWLDREVVYNTPSDDALAALVQAFKDHQIGTIYVYTSSLKADNTWSGILEQTNRFQEVEPLVSGFAQRLKIAYPEANVLAWIEVLADTPTYRLNSPQVQTLVSDFSTKMVNTLQFDGVFLDIKPVFDGNEDLLVLLRAVRGAIGIETPIAVSVSPDLTPTGTDLNLPSFIAPNTVWSDQYKQRVSLQADQMVITAYNSYLTDPVDYIKWVSYQVEAFTRALSGMDTPSEILVSVPNYANRETTPPFAHTAVVETIAGALDGVVRALPQLDATQMSHLQGIAIYTDQPLTDADWQIFRDKWLNKPTITPKQSGG